MDRDYRYLGLNYNRLLEQQQLAEEQSSSRRSQPGAGAEPPPPPPRGLGGAPGLPLLDPRNWNHTITSEEYDMSVCEEVVVAGAAPPTLHAPTLHAPTLQLPTLHVQHSIHSQHTTTTTKKRKPLSFGSSSTSAYDADGSSEDTRSVRTLPEYKKQTHNEVEKRRRDKMNAYISELSGMMPSATWGPMSKKLDKLTVLKMAVKYLRGVKGAAAGDDPWTARPPSKYLTERELNELVVRAARGAFLIVVGCDGGTLLYVSDSVRHILHYDQSELVGESILELLHPSDIPMFKDQLSSSDGSPQERFLDKEEVNVDVSEGGGSRFCSGARRSFFCRIKCRPPPGQQGVKEDPDSSCDHSRKRHKNYCVIQCTGYLKSWYSAEVSEMGVGGEGGGEEMEACKLSCLVAVGRALADLVQQPQPPELVQRPPKLAEQPPPPAPPTRLVQFMSRHDVDGKFLFVDPRVTLALEYLPHELVGTKLHEHVPETEMEHVVARTYTAALHKREKLLTPSYSFRKKDRSLVRIQTHFKPFKNPWTKEEEHLVANNTIVEEVSPPYGAVSKQEEMQVPVVGEVAEVGEVGESPAAPLASTVLREGATPFNIQQLASVEPSWVQVRDELPPLPGPVGGEWGGNLDGNDEAAMSIIMSLLEADAGLGGPVNLSGLPWPLP